MEIKTYHPTFWGGGYVLTRPAYGKKVVVYYFNNGKQGKEKISQWFNVDEEGIDLTVDAEEVVTAETPLVV